MLKLVYNDVWDWLIGRIEMVCSGCVTDCCLRGNSVVVRTVEKVVVCEGIFMLRILYCQRLLLSPPFVFNPSMDESTK